MGPVYFRCLRANVNKREEGGFLWFAPAPEDPCMVQRTDIDLLCVFYIRRE